MHGTTFRLATTMQQSRLRIQEIIFSGHEVFEDSFLAFRYVFFLNVKILKK